MVYYPLGDVVTRTTIPDPIIDGDLMTVDLGGDEKLILKEIQAGTFKMGRADPSYATWTEQRSSNGPEREGEGGVAPRR